MSPAPRSSPHRRQPTNWVREAFAVLLALPATLLTAYAAWGVVDLATTTYIEAEVLTVQIIVVSAGVLAVFAWAGAIGLHKSARRELRPAPRRLLVTGLIAAVGLSALALLGLPGWMSVGASALGVACGIGALVGAVRM